MARLIVNHICTCDRRRKYSLKVRKPGNSLSTRVTGNAFLEKEWNCNESLRSIWIDWEKSNGLYRSISRIARLFEGELNEWSRHDRVTTKSPGATLPIGRPRRGVEYCRTYVLVFSHSSVSRRTSVTGEIKVTRYNRVKVLLIN